MKIEAGKYYRTRDGRKVGPMKGEFGYCTSQEHGSKEWRGDGKYWNGEGSGRDWDLIAEWTDKPANEAPKPPLGVEEYSRLMHRVWDAEKQSNKPSPFVTRRELVPGVYGRVFVRSDEDGLYARVVGGVITADELDEAAHLFAQLAEYLRETK